MRSVPTKNTGDTLTAEEFNELISQELQNSVLTSGQALSAIDFNQLGKALAIYAATSDFYTDIGAVNSYVLNPLGSPTRQAPPSLIDGIRVRFEAGNTNTGASTINLNALGVVNLTRNGVALVGGEIQAGKVIEAVYDSSAGEFVFVSTSLSPLLDIVNTFNAEIIAAAGIKIGGTAATNLFDDYEKNGTFTPVLVGLTTAGVGTYTTQLGRYSKVSNTIHYEIELIWTAHTGTGGMRITGLPFIPIGKNSASAPWSNNLNFGAGKQLVITTLAGTDSVTISASDPTGGVNLGVIVDTSASLTITGSYQI